MDFSKAVVIGRFQPFHNDHLEVVKHALEIAPMVIIVIGSSHQAPSIRNPFSLRERMDMIEDTLSDQEKRRLRIVGVRDYYYNDNAWLAAVQSATDAFISPGESVALVGSFKDASSHWLRMFPQWEFVPVNGIGQNATEVREWLFDRDIRFDWQGKPSNPPVNGELAALADKLPHTVIDQLWSWVKTPTFGNLCKEYKFIQGYKESWSAAPFPPVFVTADAIVVCSGHVLVIKRKVNPGKGLYAVPGGFIRQNEFVRDGAIRELREETGIRLDKQILESSIVDSCVFDYPNRSERGRTITHGFYLKLKDGKLPEIKAGDDAAEALWMPLMDAFRNEEKFFEDHLHIIQYFVGAQGER